MNIFHFKFDNGTTLEIEGNPLSGGLIMQGELKLVYEELKKFDDLLKVEKKEEKIENK